MSALKFSSDSKHLLCTSLTPAQHGGGIIYLFKVSPEGSKRKRLEQSSRVTNFKNAVHIDWE
jgi:hypothetical protein